MCLFVLLGESPWDKDGCRIEFSSISEDKGVLLCFLPWSGKFSSFSSFLRSKESFSHGLGIRKWMSPKPFDWFFFSILTLSSLCLEISLRQMIFSSFGGRVES